jgi:Domain of unknown function (DUF4139)/N-terminal domain of unknown function (DUF4140)
MKIAFTLLICVVSIFASAQDDQKAKSTIKQVTVFLQGAQVTRQANVPLKSGITTLTLTGISPAIQEQSIQVEAPTVKILSVSFRVNYLDEVQKPEKISELEQERRRLLGLITQEESFQEVYKEEESILRTNKSIGGTAKGVEIQELKIAMDYFRQRLLEIKQQQLQINKNIRKYNEEVGKIEAQLRELSSVKAQPTGEITIKISAKNAIQADMKVKYVVQEARWFPSYDIRAVNIKSPIGVTYKANVSQQSGENWENVELTISSGNPTEVGARPIIKPWLLGFNNTTTQSYQSVSPISTAAIYGSRAPGMIRGRVVDLNGEPMPGVNVVMKGTSVGSVTDAEGYYSVVGGVSETLVFSFVGYQAQEVTVQGRDQLNVTLADDKATLSEVVVTGYGVERKRDVTGALSGKTVGVRIRGTSSMTNIVATPVVRQTNFEFKLDEPFSIKSDGEVRATDMVEYELDALYEYYCVPKLETDAFLVAKVMNWDEYNFLEGEASLFFEGKYIGKSIMDTRNTSDTLTLSLGRDPNVLVTREKVKDLSSRQFVGTNQKATMAYDISIRNKKAFPITIVIEDQIPVATTKEISIDKIEDSNGEYAEETGMIKWKKEIAPGKTEKMQLKYAVRYPKSSTMILE